MEYSEVYKKMFLVSAALILISIGVIFVTIQNTGDFVHKGVSLSGGVSASVTLQEQVTRQVLEEDLRAAFSEADFAVRRLDVSQGFGYVVEASDLAADEQEAARILEEYLNNNYSVTDISVETTGPTLGDAFFVQTKLGILLAFLWMGWVVFLYFGRQLWLKFALALLALVCTGLVTSGTLDGNIGLAILFTIVMANMILYLFISVPSGAIILAAASTIVFTIAVINLLGVRLSTAGVAAFLMIIGYSVDTDILLSTRVLRAGTTDQSIEERLWGAFKTGMTMQVTTMIAVTTALIFATNEVVTQIMLILLIGLVGDILFTWLQNAGIIYWYVHRMKAKGVRVA
jgi:preprotein translocase subunit SecF